ncbi:hypothetical protein DJ564_14380 [Pseudomonas sp. 31-12]|nr:hypothetical protein [Pseudomonas sp. 31-12]AWM91922.1 hypothetical protein DJ564_14380 [Pseudomonas sp. 31-12]
MGQFSVGGTAFTGAVFGQRQQSTHFLTKTLPKVSTEMSLHVLAYNLKRMMSIFGIAGLLEAIRA